MSGIYKNIEEDFFLDEQLLRKVVDVINVHCSKLPYETESVYKIYKSDSTFAKLDSIDHVLDDDNSPKKKIDRFLVEVHNKETKDQANAEEVLIIDLDKDHQTRIHIAINDKDRDWSFLFADDLLTQISRVTRGKFWVKLQERWIQTIVYVFCSLFMSYLFYSLIPFSSYDAIIINDGSPQHMQVIYQTHLILSALVSIFFMTLMAIWMPIYTLAEWVGESVFYWGDEIARFDKAKAVKKNLFWVCVVGFVISFAASVLS